MRLARLLRMGPSEFARRGLQAAAKRFDRVALAASPEAHAPGCPFDHLARDATLRDIRDRARKGKRGAAAELLLARFRREGAARFFEGAANDRTAALINERMPAVRRRIIGAADSVCERRFDVLGYRRVSFGEPVDWHLDPIAGRRAPRVHFSRIDPLDADAVGDSKIIWELNRHQWLLDLGQAYRLTGDERYAGAFMDLTGEWMRANPPGLGINWASSLEVAYRLIAWCWALFLFRDSKALTAERFVQMLGWIRRHAVHVEQYLSVYFSPNTHLTGEALGLYYAGVVFPELKEARRWRALGQRILIEQLDQQVFPDGVYFEQSTFYQRYTAEIYLHFLILAARNGAALPEAGARTGQMLEFLLSMMRPDGSVPQVGDTDGGCVLPLLRRSPEDYRGLFSVAAAWLQRSDLAWAAGELSPEVLWLLGPPGLRAFESLDPAPPRGPGLDLFPHGGYAVMRSGWDRNAHQLIFDAGPLGCRVSGAHGHADLLSIQCAVYGEPFLVDPGTGCYTADPKWRAHFRQTAAHSTVVVDATGQAEPTGPFTWKSRPRARFRQRISTAEFDLLDADHCAYLGLPDPVTHRRRVFFARPRFFVLVDDLDGAETHHVSLHFQFAPLDVSLDASGWVRARGSSGRGLLLRTFATVPTAPALDRGGLDPIRGWTSPDYGRIEPAPLVTYECSAQLPLRLVTLLLPLADADAPPPEVRLEGCGQPTGLEIDSWRERIGITSRDVYLESYSTRTEDRAGLPNERITCAA